MVAARVSVLSQDIHIGNLEIRPGGCEVLAGDERVPLTVREFQLLEVLAKLPNRVVQRAEIYDAVWGGPMRPRDRSVDVLIRKVRTKLEATSPNWRYIHTHFGVGYRFQPERIPADENPAADPPARVL